MITSFSSNLYWYYSVLFLILSAILSFLSQSTMDLHTKFSHLLQRDSAKYGLFKFNYFIITFLAKVIQYCLVGRKFRHILKTCYTKREYFSCNPTFKSDNFVEVQIFLWSTFPWTILFWVWQITGILKTVTFGINIALAIANIKANNFFLHWLKYDILCITGSEGVSL